MSHLIFTPRSIAFSAFRAGYLVSVLVRPSKRASTGAVVVCHFASAKSASAFAKRWAMRLSIPVAVQAGGLLVSIPVNPARIHPLCFGRLAVNYGGLRGFLNALRSAGVLHVC